MGYYNEVGSKVQAAYQLSLKGRYRETLDEFSQALNLAEKCAVGIPMSGKSESLSHASGPYDSISLVIEISENVNRLLA